MTKTIGLIGLFVLAACKPIDPPIPYQEYNYTNIVTKVRSSNLLPNGVKIEFAGADTTFVDAILYTDHVSNDPTAVDQVAEYALALKSTPKQMKLTFVVPNKQERIPALYDQGVWSEATNYIVQGDAVVIDVVLDFVAVSRTQVYPTVNLGLVDRSTFYTAYDIVKNPFGNPLAALANFTHKTSDISVRCTVEGQNDNDIVRTYAPAQTHQVPVVGLYAQWDNTVNFELTTAKGTRFSFDQNVYCNLPFYNDIVVETKFKPGFRNAPDELYITNSNRLNLAARPGVAIPDEKIDAINPVGYDQWGKIRFAYQLHDAYTFLPINYKGQQALGALQVDEIVIIDFLGQELLRAASPSGYIVHHEMTNISPTRVVLGYAQYIDGVAAPDEYGLVEFDLETKEFSNEIDLRKIITTNRPLITTNLNDIIHTNAIAYSASDDSFVVSMRQQGVVKIKRTTHEVVWLMTPHVMTQYLTPEARAALITPLNFSATEPDDWNLGQHASTILPSGEVMIFDNHNQTTDFLAPWTKVSRITSYRIDEANKTITKVWDFRTPDKKFSFYMGSAYLLPNGNVLGTWPVYQYACEVKYGTSDVVWESSFQPIQTRGDVYRTYKVQIP